MSDIWTDMQYRVSQLSECLIYLPAYVTGIFLGRKCVKIPHMTKGHICAPHIFQRKRFQSIFPHTYGAKILRNSMQKFLTLPHIASMDPGFCNRWFEAMCIHSFLLYLYSRSKLLGRISEQAMRHDSKRQITLAVC